MAEEIHEDDEGTEMIARVKDGGAIIDLNLFTTYKYRFRPPNVATIEVSAEFYNDGDDGMLVYITPVGFFEGRKGPWVWQVVLTSVEGKWHSDKKRFTVYENI